MSVSVRSDQIVVEELDAWGRRIVWRHDKDGYTRQPQFTVKGGIDPGPEKTSAILFAQALLREVSKQAGL